MGKRTPDYKNWNAWTTARFWTFIRSALRVAWNKYPPKYAALKNASVGKQINKDTDRLAEHFKCNECKDCFPAKKVQVDHIHDAGSLKDYSDLPAFVERLFCSVSDLQVMCKRCHAVKTKNTARVSRIDADVKKKKEQSTLTLFEETASVDTVEFSIEEWRDNWFSKTANLSFSENIECMNLLIQGEDWEKFCEDKK